jgi:hypothetical protein
VTVDDVSIDNVRDAVAAAWIVDRNVAVEIAKRYGLYDNTCLRCGWGPLAAVDPTNVLMALYGALAYQLCLKCHYDATHEELGKQLRQVGC